MLSVELESDTIAALAHGCASSWLRCGHAGGTWTGPQVGSTVRWQEGGDARAPLVASVLEQFGRMTALARETTTSLLTSPAYWGAQPGGPTSSSCLCYAILTALV